MKQVSTLRLARWAGAGEASGACAVFMREPEVLADSLAGIHVLLGADSDDARVAELLERGAGMVLLGELARRDAGAIRHLSQQHGSERIGVWLETARTSISWTIADEAPNAGFKCMYPSRAVPCWEILDSNGVSTGTDSDYWLRDAFAQGASMALICMDIHEDDLNICAGLNIEHEGKIWFTPFSEPGLDLEPAVRWGKVRQLLLPEPNERDEAEMARIAEPALVMVEETEELPQAAAADSEAAGETETAPQGRAVSPADSA